MQKVEIRSRYRDTAPIFTSRLMVAGGCVYMSESTHRKYCDRLCYAGEDNLLARSVDDGRELIVAIA